MYAEGMWTTYPSRSGKNPIVSTAAEKREKQARPSSVMSRRSSELVKPVPPRAKTTNEINVNAESSTFATSQTMMARPRMHRNMRPEYYENPNGFVKKR